MTASSVAESHAFILLMVLTLQSMPVTVRYPLGAFQAAVLTKTLLSHVFFPFGCFQGPQGEGCFGR